MLWMDRTNKVYTFFMRLWTHQGEKDNTENNFPINTHTHNKRSKWENGFSYSPENYSFGKRLTNAKCIKFTTCLLFDYLIKKKWVLKHKKKILITTIFFFVFLYVYFVSCLLFGVVRYWGYILILSCFEFFWLRLHN